MIYVTTIFFHQYIGISYRWLSDISISIYWHSMPISHSMKFLSAAQTQNDGTTYLIKNKKLKFMHKTVFKWFTQPK